MELMNCPQIAIVHHDFWPPTSKLQRYTALELLQISQRLTAHCFSFKFLSLLHTTAYLILYCFETSTPHEHKNQTNNHKKRWNDVGNHHQLLRPLVLVWAGEILRIQMILLLLLLYCLCWRNDRRLHNMRIDDCKNQQSKSNYVLHYIFVTRSFSFCVLRIITQAISMSSIQKTVAGTFVHVSIDLCLHEYDEPSSTISTHSISNNSNRQQ